MPTGKVYTVFQNQSKFRFAKKKVHIIHLILAFHAHEHEWIVKKKKNMNGSVQVVQKPSANASRTECSRHYIYTSLSSSLNINLGDLTE